MHVTTFIKAVDLGEITLVLPFPSPFPSSSYYASYFLPSFLTTYASIFFISSLIKFYTTFRVINNNVVLCGRISVSMTHCHIQVPYKYVVQLKGVMYYERLIEFYGTDVNRCFEIPREVVKNNGKITISIVVRVY